MAHGARFIDYKGKEIYYVNYSNIKTNEEFVETIKQTNAFREKVKAEGKRTLPAVLFMVKFWKKSRKPAGLPNRLPPGKLLWA